MSILCSLHSQLVLYIICHSTSSLTVVWLQKMPILAKFKCISAWLWCPTYYFKWQGMFACYVQRRQRHGENTLLAFHRLRTFNTDPPATSILLIAQEVQVATTSKHAPTTEQPGKADACTVDVALHWSPSGS